MAKLKTALRPETLPVSEPRLAATSPAGNAEDALWGAVEKGNSADDYNAYPYLYQLRLDGRKVGRRT
jgi:hypothetical protein